VDLMKDKKRTYQEQAAEVESAYGRYLTRVAELAGLRQCASWWVDNITRCQLVAGHNLGPGATSHRYRPAGAPEDQAVTW
jgi:hypothetical protein